MVAAATDIDWPAYRASPARGELPPMPDIDLIYVEESGP